jgi:hypothetical protein
MMRLEGGGGAGGVGLGLGWRLLYSRMSLRTLGRFLTGYQVLSRRV